MPIYCDESGGIGPGVMTFAAVALPEGRADDLLDRFRVITGLRGELKGSRIDLTERGLMLELFAHSGGRVHVARLLRAAISDRARTSRSLDLDAYSQLLDDALEPLLPSGTAGDGAFTHVVIDDGRYDPRILGRVRAHVAAGLGAWGRATMVESHRCAGVQIADVMANTVYNMAMGGHRADRMERIAAPMIDCGQIIIRDVALS